MAGTAPPVQGPEGMADAGLVKFLENTKGAGEHARGKAEKWEGLLQMAEDLPLDPQVKEDLRAKVKIYRAAAEVGDAIYGDGRRHHDADYGRAQEPRGGSIAVESKADVEKGRADGHFS